MIKKTIETPLSDFDAAWGGTYHTGDAQPFPSEVTLRDGQEWGHKHSEIEAAVKNRVNSIVYDISATHLTNNQPTVYANLDAALGNNGANVPASARKGGMSVRFIQGSAQSSDNKYVQFRYMSYSTAVANFTNVANWQGVDEEPINGSDNLVKSGGVSKLLFNNYFIGNDDVFVSTKIVGLVPNRRYSVIIKNPNYDRNNVTSQGYLFNIRNSNGDNLVIVGVGGTISQTYTIAIPSNSDYITIGGRANDGVKVEFNIVELTTIEDIIEPINQRILRNRDVVSYSGTNVVIDNETRTISFDGNVVIVNTQGQPITLTTQNKQTTFDAEPTDFSNTTMAVVVLKSNNTLAVKQYDKLAADDYALIGIKFDRVIGSGTTPTTTTKVVSYSSVLPIKFGTTLKELSGIVNIHNEILNDYVLKRNVYPCPSADWNIYQRTINAGDELYLTSSVVRSVVTLSSTSSSSSEYRLEGITLQAGTKKTFNITKDAVAIMFYGKGDVIVDEGALLDEKIIALENRFNGEVLGEEKTLPCPSAGWNIYPMTISGGDAFYLNSTILRSVFTLSSTSSSDSQYRLDNIQLQPNKKTTFVTTQDAVAIMFYGSGSVTLQKLGKLTKDVENIKKDIIRIDGTTEIVKNNDFNSLLRSITQSVTRNVKLGGLLYVTDLHSDLKSLQQMVALKTALNLNLPLLNGGDTVGGYPRTTEGQAVINEYMQICATNNVYHVIGQHEVGFAPSANPDALIGRTKSSVYSHQETFDRYFAPLKDGWGLSSLDKCYYYKDFGKVRLITLYHYNRPEIDDPENAEYYKYQRALVWYGSEQLQWFANTLGSMSEGQVAVILCHQPTKLTTPLTTSKFQSGSGGWAPNIITTDDPITEIVNAFRNKTQLVKTYTPTNTTKYLVADGFEESVSIDFGSSEGTFGFMLMGDNHYDAVGTVDGVLCLCLTSSGNECADGVVTTNTGYNSDYIINALGIKSDSVELGRVGQQYFCGVKRDIERLDYTQS